MRDPLRDTIGRGVVAHVAGVSVRGTVRAVTRASVVLDDVVVVDNGIAADADGSWIVDRPAMFQVPDPTPTDASRRTSGVT
jgi:hypothetical protein